MATITNIRFMDFQFGFNQADLVHLLDLANAYTYGDSQSGETQIDFYGRLITLTQGEQRVTVSMGEFKANVEHALKYFH